MMTTLLLTLTLAAAPIDDLRALAPLPKPHYSWNYSNAQLLGTSADAAETREVARICGAVGISVRNTDAAIKAAGTWGLPVAVNYSPWAKDRVLASQPSEAEPELYGEVAWIGRRMRQVRTLLGNAAVPVVLIDDEQWEREPVMLEWRKRLAATIRDTMPGAALCWYQHSAVTACASESGYCESPIRAPVPTDYASCQLYSPPHREQMREHVRRTAANTDLPLMVWMPLGCGYHPEIDAFHRWRADWQYSTAYSWLWGIEIHNHSFAGRPTLYAPWGRVKAVIWYAGPNSSPTWMEHFIAYAQGAAK